MVREKRFESATITNYYKYREKYWGAVAVAVVIRKLCENISKSLSLVKPFLVCWGNAAMKLRPCATIAEIGLDFAATALIKGPVIED